MSEKLKKIEFKRMLKRYESALEDLEYLQEMASEINSDFNSALAAKKRQDLFESKKVEDLSENTEEEKESPTRDPLFKKLFRKIVVQCHPDRMDPDLSIKQQAERLDFYELANKANDEDNMALLITVAIKLEIELSEEYLQHVEKIEEELNTVNEKIKNIQGSAAWQWYHLDEDKKEEMLDQYVKHMEKVLTQPIKKKKTILGIGHPRTGTGYTSKLLQSMGLKVGHEVMGIDGIVAWQFAADRKPWPYISREASRDNYDFQITIYNVRNPITSIPSIVYTEDKTLSYRSLAGNFMQTSNLVKNAVRSIIAWDKLVLSKNPDFIYRIEDQSEDLYNFLISKGLKVKKPKDIGPQNIRKHPGLSDNIQTQIERLDDELKSQLNNFCERHGYPKMF